MKPKYHGQDKAAAIQRAKTISHGIVIYSLKDGEKLGAPNAEFGFWSDEESLIRPWEKVVYPYEY